MKVFKSSFWLLARRFLLMLVGAVFIIVSLGAVIGALLLQLERDLLLNPLLLIIFAIIAVLIAIYLSFIRNSITVIVTSDVVKLLKGEKVYRSFPLSDYSFSAFNHRSVSYLALFTIRYLRVKELKKNKEKDYRLFFSAKNMAKLMAALSSEPETPTILERNPEPPTSQDENKA